MQETLERLKARRDDEGFTLIELLIVIIILAILATIVIFAVGTTTHNAAAASCKSTVKEIQTAVEAYKAQTGTFPGALTVLAGTTTGRTGTTVGPWLKSTPPTSATANKNYWFSNTVSTTGAIKVYTHGDATGATTTTTICGSA
ncbi:MAG: prepilin-type N-terminal cleavage/methylation domain-containing protein [Actinomycetota bacterium]|nr:prepilin-type N-terminal cleavage/methylation domain-containing protein [Actinomycetota bacterium]